MYSALDGLILIKRQPEYHVCLRRVGGQYHYCYRLGVHRRGRDRMERNYSFYPKENPAIWGPHDICLFPKGSKGVQNGVVCLCSLHPSLRERWKFQPGSFHIIAESSESAVKWCKTHFGRIAALSEGLAQSAFDHLMHKVSFYTEKETEAKATRKAKKTANRETFVVEKIGKGNYTLSLKDNLTYAQLAIKGGRAGVDLALMRAANKIAGHIRHTCQSKFFTLGELPLPFPGIAKHRNRSAS